MTDPDATAHRALSRAEKLLADLDDAFRPGDARQAVHGALHEIRLAQRVLLPGPVAVEEAALRAVANMEGKLRADAPETSRRAARSITLKSGGQRGQILLTLAKTRVDSGLTDYELQNWLDIGASSERPRRGELVELGLVSARPETRNHHGTDWTIWSLTERGRQVAAKLVDGMPVEVTPTAEGGQLMIL